MRTRSFRRDIQGLRGLAVALVVVEHAQLALPGGFVGVDIFFVISGFVITTVLLRDMRARDFSMTRFWTRRANRLLPAAAVVVTVTAVGTALLLSPFGTQQQASGTGAAASVGLSNVALYFISADYFSEHVQSNPFLHTWSLGVEEQFYLFFPILLLVLLRLDRGRSRAVIGGLLALGVASFAISTLFSFSAVMPGFSSPAQFAFYMTPTRAWEFTTGALVAVFAGPFARGRWQVVGTSVGLGMIALAALLVTPGGAYPGVLALLPAGGAALVIAGGCRTNAVGRALAWRPLRRLGDASYSLYLWHWPLLVFAWRMWPGELWPVVVAVGAALVLAFCTHRFIEMPFRSRPSDSIIRSLRAPVLSVAAGGTACALVLVGALTSWSNPAVAAAGEQLLARPAGYAECLSTVPVSQRDLSACTWGSRDGRPVYLLGDSNAQQYTEAVRSAAERTGRRLVVATWGGCPFIDVDLERSTAASKGDECTKYVEDTSAWLDHQPRGTVMLAASSEMVLSPDDSFADRDGRRTRVPTAKAAIWGDRLTERMRALQDAGFDVALIHTLPHFPSSTRTWWHPVECQNATVYRDPDDCAASIPRQEVERRQHLIRAAEFAAVSDSDARAVDVFDDVCRDGTCDTFRAGTWLYRDGLHISPRYSNSLSPAFEDALGPR